MSLSAWGRFWDRWTLEPERLTVFRFTLYALVCWDSLRLVPVAPRRDLLHLPHLPEALAAWVPHLTGTQAIALLLCQAWCAAMIAVGAGSRVLPGVVALTFGTLYFSSQFDTYQHHYLMAMVLLAGVTVPWDKAGLRGRKRVTGLWGIRLVLVLVSVVYLWTARAKMHPHWISGETLSAMVHGWPHQQVGRAATWTGLSPESLWALIAGSVIPMQLFLAFGIHLRPLRAAATLLGLLFHGLLVAAGFQIGLFSGYMFVIYLLILPDAWWRPAQRPSRFLGLALQQLQRRMRLSDTAARAVGGISVLTASAGLLAVGLPGAPAAAAAALVLGASVWWTRRQPLRHPWVAPLLSTGAVVGGAALLAVAPSYWYERGLLLQYGGAPAEASAAYQRSTRLDPTDAEVWIRLGRMHEQLGDPTAALSAFEHARETGGDRMPTLLGLLRTHHALGHADEAATMAREVLDRDPRNATAARVFFTPSAP